MRRPGMNSMAPGAHRNVRVCHKVVLNKAVYESIPVCAVGCREKPLIAPNGCDHNHGDNENGFHRQAKGPSGLIIRARTPSIRDIVD